MNNLGNTTGPVQSIDRVLDIIEILASTPSGMFLGDISEKSNLHVSTVHRLLKALIARGYVRKDRISGKYCLTMHLFEVGCHVSGALDLLSLARPYLDELADIAKEAVHLVKRDDTDVVYLYKAVPIQLLMRMSSYVGSRNPMFCTGVGKSILAFLPDCEVEDVWTSSNVKKIARNTITDFSELKAQLAEARENGYALDNEENEDGVFCIAAPIFDWRNVPVAAVSISAPIERMGAETRTLLIPKLLQVSEEISVQMGCVLPQNKSEK